MTKAYLIVSYRPDGADIFRGYVESSTSSDLELYQAEEQEEAIDKLAAFIFEAAIEEKGNNFGTRENHVYVNGIGAAFDTSLSDPAIENIYQEAHAEIALITKEAECRANINIEAYNKRKERLLQEQREKAQYEADTLELELLEKRTEALKKKLGRE